MTDLEITKLCAEAMGIDYFSGTEVVSIRYPRGDSEIYDPLHDDAQAMALVKKFGVTIERFHETWHVWPQDADFTVISESLNSAVCGCVVKMQAAKK